MQEHVITAIENAISNKTSITIKYNGGSQPGRVREIFPTKISGERLFAFCTASSMNKFFLIEKIELEGLAGAGNYGDEVELLCNTLSDVEQAHWLEWEQYGWHVESGDTFIDLFKIRKNGSISKHPTVGIVYEEETYHYTDFDGKHFYREADRPWVVYGRGQTTVRYLYFQKAIERFIEYSRTVPAK